MDARKERNGSVTRRTSEEHYCNWAGIRKASLKVTCELRCEGWGGGGHGKLWGESVLGRGHRYQASALAREG